MKTTRQRHDIRHLTAADVMTTEVISIREEATADELLALFGQHRLRSVPVLDNAGRLSGVASTTDLVRTEIESRMQPGSDFYQNCYPEIDIWAIPPEADLSQRRVFEIMGHPPVTATPYETLPVLARRMRTEGVHLLVVTQEGAIRGVVSTMDILDAVAGLEG